MNQIRWNNVQGVFACLYAATIGSCGLVVSIAMPPVDPEGVLDLID